MAGDKIIIRTGANMMVHEASTMAFGNKSDIQKTLNAFAIDTSIVDIYHDRTGLDRDEIVNLITNETWLTADEESIKVLQMRNHLVNLLRSRKKV